MAITKSDVAQALDQTLSDLITLDLAVRQARGNLAGTSLHSAHRLLFGLADVAREAGNRIAARSIQLGHNPNLWADMAARKSALRLVDVQPLHHTDAYSAFEQILATITTRLIANISASDCDLVTQSLMIGLADRLDNIAWTIHARPPHECESAHALNTALSRKELPMTSTTIAIQPPMTRDEVATLVGRTMSLVAVTAGAFALGAYLGRDFSHQWSWLLLLVSLATLFGINAAAQHSANLAVAMLVGFGLLVGLSMAPTLSYFANSDPQALWQAGGATALLIAGAGAAGYATRRDLSTLARYFFWALVALIVFGIVLIFVQIPGGMVIYSLVGLVIFAGLTAFDFQRLRQNRDIRSAPLLAVSIFLDILNVFTLFLGLFGGSTE